MAKKTKRKVSTVVKPAPAPEVKTVEKTTTAPQAKAPLGRRSTTSSSTEFNPDYTYVIRDLKRIGLLAGSFFVILVVLSFIL